MFKCVILLTIFLTSVLCANQRVKTTKGIVEGFVQREKGKTFTTFLGIPYAKPPLAKRRFNPPEAADSWNEVMETLNPKPACPQNKNAVKNTLGPDFNITETDEDCLYLNVYVPGKPRTTKTKPVAVMVFIHGGDFQSESATLWKMSGLVINAKVIVVSMNFRLGVLGFLSTECPSAPGNWGLMDQKLALQWIQDNIEEFGGDKSRVTIFGEGSGAYSVGLHILSPLSRGLFHRAISLGGSIASPSWLLTDPMKRVKPLAMMTKCLTRAAMQSGKFINSEMVECLRSVSVSELMRHDAMTAGSFTPVVDKHFLPDDPVAILKSGEFSPVDYIIGANSGIGSKFCNHIPDFYTHLGINMTDFEKNLVQVSSLALTGPVPKMAEQALTAVISSKYFPREANLNTFRISYLNAVGDAMTSKIFQTGQLYSSKGKVYVFHFTYKPSDSRFPDYVGPGHAEELPFLLGYTLNSGNEEEKSLSMNWMKTWGRFAQTGNPNFNNGSLVWSPYTTPSMSYLEITVNMTSQSLKTNWKTDVRRFWNIAIPEVAKLTGMAPKDTPQDCHILDWGLTADQADALFLVLIMLCCFMFFISAGLTLILYKTNVRIVKLAQSFVLHRNDGVTPCLKGDDNPVGEDHFKPVDMQGCNTRL